MLSNLRRSTFLPTLCSCLALLLWSSSAYLSVALKKIPPFQLTAFTMTSLFVIKVVQIVIFNKWSCLKQPWYIYVGGSLFFTGFNFLYYLAFKFAPAAEVDIINYLWPIMIIILSGALPDESFSGVHLLSAAIGFLSIWVLFQGECSWRYIWGYIAAFSGALCWVAYNLLHRHYSDSSSAVIGIYGGVSAIFCSFLHFATETTVAPTTSQWVHMLLLGFIIVGFSYSLWDFGLKRGSIQTLSICSYFTPIVSILILVITGEASLTPSITISAL